MISSYARTFLVAFVLLTSAGFAGTAYAADTACTSHVRDFTPYVYSDGLNSFDYFYEGGVPVVLKTTVGSYTLEPRYTSIWNGSAGITKVHVDVPSWYPISGNVPVQVVVASTGGCLETAQFEVFVPPQAVSAPVVTDTSAKKTPVVHYTPTKPSPVTPIAQPETVAPSTPIEEAPSATEFVAASEPFEVSCATPASLSWKPAQPTPLSHVVERREIGFGKFAPIAKLSGNVSGYEDMKSEGKAYVYRVVRLNSDGTVVSSEPVPCYTPDTVVMTPTTTASGLAAACRSWGSSAWGFLLALHLAAAVITISYLQSLIAGNGWRFTTALFVPFALMLLLWFIFDGCRTSQWFPISVSLITLIALIIGPAFGEIEETSPDVSTHVNF